LPTVQTSTMVSLFSRRQRQTAGKAHNRNDRPMSYLILYINDMDIFSC